MGRWIEPSAWRSLCIVDAIFICYLLCAVPDEIAEFIIRLFVQFKAFLALCILEGVCWLLIFGSNRTLDYFRLTSIAHKWRGLLSLIFIGVSTLILLCAVHVFSRQILDNWEERSRIKNYVRNATRDEAIILVKISESGSRSASFNPKDDAVESLVQAGVLRGIPTTGLKSVYGPTDLATPYLERKRLGKLLAEKYKNSKHSQ
jgi:hypothetical protein